MSKNQKPSVDRAVAIIRKPRSTDVQKVSTTRALSAGLKNSPDWANAATVQAADATWNLDADAMEANAKAIRGFRDQLRTAEAKQHALRRNWRASTKHTQSAVTVFCAGSADKVKAFGFDVFASSPIGALVAPLELALKPGKLSGELVASWSKGNAGHGFVVQHATDPGNAATVSTPQPCTKVRFTLGGMPSGASTNVRVAAIDPASPTGQSPWSAWVLGNAR